jgi:hypothetical protein
LNLHTFSNETEFFALTHSVAKDKQRGRKLAAA